MCNTMNYTHETQAAALGKVVLDTKKRVFGANHPTTLAAAENLALFHSELDNHAQAEALYRLVLVVGDFIFIFG
jgi:hypothetical protein